MGCPLTSFFEIEEFINGLPEKDKLLIKNLYDLSSSDTAIEIPKTLEQKVVRYLIGCENGDLNNAERQKLLNNIKNQRIVRVVNRWTYESALYNYWRAFRPGMNTINMEKLTKWLKENITEKEEGCDFCNPEKYTPEDSFGRIYGKYCVTSANLARFEEFHSLLIFNKHNPLDFNREEFFDYMETAFRWFSRVKDISNNYRFPLLVWNCLPRAGASRVHGHMQLLAGASIFPKMKLIVDSSIRFFDRHKRNYFEALYEVHNILGLSRYRHGVKIMCYLTPIKEREIFIMSEKIDDIFIDILYNILRGYIDTLKVISFNLSLYEIPLNENGNCLYITRIVDRGNVFTQTSDIAAMELYASPVIAQDPLQLRKKVFDHWLE